MIVPNSSVAPVLKKKTVGVMWHNYFTSVLIDQVVYLHKYVVDSIATHDPAGAL